MTTEPVQGGLVPLEEETAKALAAKPALRPEDVLSQDTLDEVDRKFAQAEVDFAERPTDESAWENALTVDEVRELARRAGRGEKVSLKTSVSDC